MKTTVKNHRHIWITSSVAMILAVLLLVMLPSHKTYSFLLTGFAGGHLILAFIALFAGWMITPQELITKIFGKREVKSYDFGWTPKSTVSFFVASVIVLLLSFHVYFSLEYMPMLRLIAYTLLLLLSVNFFIGFVIFRSSKREAELTLPLVKLLPEDDGLILDAGCGAGRTTVALAKAFPNARIVSFDRFDADYIEGGGSLLIKKNIRIAGAEQRVTIEQGDITATSFPDNKFDAIVSSFMFDHLGNKKQMALEEAFRIIKPGGRFLLIIAVRGYVTFGIANMLCFVFPTRKSWIKRIEQAGFKMVTDGKINEGTYFCFEKL